MSSSIVRRENKSETKPITSAGKYIDFDTQLNQNIIREISPVNSSVSEDFDDDNSSVNLLDEINTKEEEKEEQQEQQEKDNPPIEDANDKSNGSFRGRPSSCVFVASLAASLSDDELCISVTESFKKFGELTGVKVLRDPANRPYAFVQYANDRNAKKALKKAQGSILNGRTLRCEPARVNRTLFVTHNTAISFTQVAEACEAFGELEKLIPSRENNPYAKRYSYPLPTGNSWFVQFAYRDDAIRAFANLRSEHEWDVEWVQNTYAPKHFNLLYRIKGGLRDESDDDDDDDDDELSSSDGDYLKSKKDLALVDAGANDDEDNEIVIDKKSIFVGQLNRETTRDNLHERFSLHGKISDINLIYKPNNVFAFITYNTEEAAAAALERENHAIFLNKTMHVQYKEVGGLHGRRNHRKSSSSYYASSSSNLSHGQHAKHYMGPQFNLAPPPINLYRRKSMENDSSSMTYISQNMSAVPPIPPLSGVSDFEMNPYIPSYMKPMSMRRKSGPAGWSSTRSYSTKSENDTNTGNVTTATGSELSVSAGQANSATTYNNSSAGNLSNNNIHENNSGNSNNNSNDANNDNAKHPDNNNNYNGIYYGGNNNYTTNKTGNFIPSAKRKFSKRGSYSYNEPPNPYYFQPYFYHPIHYPMAPMGPNLSSQGSAGHLPYMMVYPMPPPPPTGMGLEGSIMGQPLPLGPGSPPTVDGHFVKPDQEGFVAEDNPYQLDY